MTRSIPVVILGGGLAGLSTARYLRVPFRLFERGAEPGGLATTTEDEGFLFDRTGHLLHIADSEIEELVRSLLGPDLLEIERRSLVWSHGVYTRYPFQANVYGLPVDVARDCVVGFVRAHFDRAATEPRTFEDYILRHFGTGVARHFMLPYNQKMWGVHPREITAHWCDRFVPLPSLEDVVRGAVGAPARELGYNVRFLYPRLGIGMLPDALAKGLSGLELGRAAARIELGARRLHLAGGEVVPFEFLVSTIPLKTLVGLLDEVPAAVAAAADSLRCNGLYYLDVGLSSPARTDFHWAYVPEIDLPFYRVGCYSNFSEALAPPGRGSLYVELESRDRPNLAWLLPSVVDALVRMGIVRSSSDIRFARLRHVDFAYVVFDSLCTSSLETIHAFLAENRILSTGRYGAWAYSSMGDALCMGRDAAGKAELTIGGST